MTVSFLILAHKLPGQVALLARSLARHPGARVYIHVDRKSAREFTELLKALRGEPRIEIIGERYRVYWGGYSQIRATLALLRSAIAHPTEYYVLLSGQDLPIRPLSELFSFLTSSRGRSFVVNFPLPDQQWDTGGLNRLRVFHFHLRWKPLQRVLNVCTFRLQSFFRLYRPLPARLYGGTNWFTLTREAATEVVNHVDRHPRFLRAFRLSRCADEIFVQTILMNSHLAGSVISDDLRYVDWSSGPEYPRILRTEDLQRIRAAQGKYFARKFDMTVDANVIQQLLASHE